MFYCFNCKNQVSNNTFEKEIKKAKDMDVFIYYDKEKKVFLDKNDQTVDVTNQEILPISEEQHLEEILEALISSKANISNDIKSIRRINEWYNYLPYRREVISFTGSMLDDKDFLNPIQKIFSLYEEGFLQNKNEDLNIVIKLEEIFDPNSALRETFRNHKDDEFLLSYKVDTDKDELGEIKYRSFIYNGQIMNISRQVEKTYHKVPKEVLIYIKAILNNLPSSFPKTFAFDVFSYNGNILDILKLTPLETANSYLYNSFFESSNDLLHENETVVPSEKENNDLSYNYYEKAEISIAKNTSNTFEEDYNSIKKSRKRIKENTSSKTIDEQFAELEGYPDLISLFAQTLAEKKLNDTVENKDTKQLKKVFKNNYKK